MPSSPRREGARALVVLVLVLSSCAAPPVSLTEGPREYVPTDYENVLERWTRSEQLVAFSELETFLTATATFESWDFRWAHLIRFARDYRLDLAQRERLFAATLAEAREHHQFFVALHGGSDRKIIDLTRPDSAWVVRLIDDTGSETAPTLIKAVRNPALLERAYFPYFSTFRQAFRLQFPRTASDGRPSVSPDATSLGLRFSGAHGSIELSWKLTPTLAPPAAK